jgi:hypothetical protein
MRRRSRTSTDRAVAVADLPVPLRRVIRAAERECPPGHAGALRDLTRLAFRKVPARGIFDPTIRDEQDLFRAIETVANRHLGHRASRAAWRRAIRRARLPLEACDRIERAAVEAQTVSDIVYFYAGLAFGLTWVSVARDR